MLLDVGLSFQEFNVGDHSDPSDALVLNADESFDDYDNVVENSINDDNYNELSVNFNGDVTKIGIYDILNEMRLSSPIENDLVIEILNDEPNNNHQISNNNQERSFNRNNWSNNNDNQLFNINIDNADNITIGEMDQIINNDDFSAPDVQLDFNNAVQFHYDISDQFNCEPDITLSYLDEAESATIPSLSISEPNLDINTGNNYDSIIEMDFEFETYLIEAESTFNKPYFECSTILPMTSEELHEDIRKYINTEKNCSDASFYEYAGMIRDTADDESNANHYPYSRDMLQEYLIEQNLLLQSSDSVNTVVSNETPNVTPQNYQSNDNYQCNVCPFYTDTLHGLSVHMNIHSEANLSCTECSFTTTRAYNLRQHQAYDHGTAYCCEICNYVTHSSSKIRSHMREEH